MTFTERVRNELAHVVTERDCCRRAELSAILRLAGALHLRGPRSHAETAGDDPGYVGGTRPMWVVSLSANAIARKVHAALHDLTGLRPTIEVHDATALRTRRYVLTIEHDIAPVLSPLGVTDATLRPLERPSSASTRAGHDTASYVRGALLAAGSVSDPRRTPHLEIRVPNRTMGQAVRGLLDRCGADGAHLSERDDGWRVFSKSGAAIGRVLTRTGAHASFLEWDGARLRRELRGEANRAANADRANLGRAVDAASRQVREIEAAVASQGWDAIPDDVRATALARLANPEVSLTELAALHDPPISKATVFRRLARLSALADGEAYQGEG